MYVRGKKLERFKRLLVGIALIAAIWAAAPDVFAQSRGTISEIVVEGAQRIEPGTIRSYLLIKEGEAADPVRINRSLKSLFATGLFADVTMRPGRIAVDRQCCRKPDHQPRRLRRK